MGKGGESSLASAGIVKNLSKLSKFSTEELENWAQQYNIPITKGSDRDSLLIALNPYAGGILDTDRPAKNLPLDPPTFTLSDIRNAIPPHCFKRNLWTSMGHLLSDLLIVSMLSYLASWISSPILPAWSSWILWPMYWYAQGSVLTGVWVLAHECGHQSFSESELVNNIVGTICHSLLLVPYHSWRITHGKHHNNTGSCENDEVFAPATRSDWGDEMLRETPIAVAFGIIRMLTVGWLPGYLVFNATGPSKYRGQNANHFSPQAVFFKPDEYAMVSQSVLSFFASVSLLLLSVLIFGARDVFFYYLIPYFIVNYHLVLITYLQHTDVFMPHFRGAEWSWLRGALCTVDRSFGPLLDHTFHHITDTHVCHHLFSKMPFYHAQEATECMKKVLGPYYLKDETPIAKALWRSFKNCQFVEDSGDIVFYKNVK